jgi:hypothetical protein
LKYIFLILFLLNCFVTTVKSQHFPPAVGFEGSTAIYKDSSVFIDWVKHAEVSPSYKDIAFPENGYANYGTNENAIGKADGNPGVVSLGDGGSAILTFNSPIINGEGFDFAVFENGFFENDTSELAFSELAYVEVSTDGLEYIRFPSISEINEENQIGSFGNINARFIHNLAGKYTMFYGTPFDLDELSDLYSGTSVNINQINFIKIIDVVGSLNEAYASFDSKGHKINDPYPTAFPSGGFDLDAAGVINNSQNSKVSGKLLIIPNPVNDFLSLKTDIVEVLRVDIYSIAGNIQLSVSQTDNINVTKLKPGIYILKIFGKNETYSTRFFKY